MGQVPSVGASDTHLSADNPQLSQHLTNTSAPSTSPSIPSIQDLQSIPSRILTSTNEEIKRIHKNIPSIEPSLPIISSANNPDELKLSEALVAHISSKEDIPTTLIDNLTDTAAENEKIFVFKPFKDSSSSNNVSMAELARIHYQHTINWFRNNKKTIALGILVIGAVIVVGNSLQKYRQKKRKLRVIKAKDGTKREIVVITNVATLEGKELALSLDQEGFIVFVGVTDQQQVDQVLKWESNAICPVIVDTQKNDPYEELYRTVSYFIDQRNSGISGEGSIYPMIYDENISSSISNIRILSPGTNQRHPYFRLAAVVVNPHSDAYGSIENVDLDQWRQSIDNNITGTFIVSKKFLSLLKRTLTLPEQSRSPRLILVSSAITGSIGLPNRSAICASHHAIEAIANSLRREIRRHGVDVICLRLGITDRSFKSNSKKHPATVGLLDTINPISILTSLYRPVSTTSAFCETTYDAITLKRPASFVSLGNSSLSYSFIGWAAPRSLVDWSTIGTPDRSMAKYSSPPTEPEE